MSPDRLHTRRPNFQGDLPDEILLTIARYTVEWSGIAKLNESSNIEPKLQRHLTITRGSQPDRQGKVDSIRKSEHRTISSTLFAFRCVCRAWYRTGTTVFLDCVRSPRYAHYAVINIPPGGQLTLQELAEMIRRSGILRNVLDKIKFHFQMEQVPHEMAQQLLWGAHATEGEQRQIYEQDAWRMWQQRMSDMQSLSIALSSVAAIVNLIGELPRLREIGVVYRHFWPLESLMFTAPKFPLRTDHMITERGSPLIRSISDALRNVIALCAHYTGLDISRIRLSNITNEFLQGMDGQSSPPQPSASLGYHYASITQTARANIQFLTNLHIRFRYQFGYNHQLPDVCPGTTWLRFARNLKCLEIEGAQHPMGDMRRNGGVTWLDLALQERSWPAVETLIIRSSNVRYRVLVGFLAYLETKIRHLTLKRVSLEQDAPMASWNELQLFLREWLSLSDLSLDRVLF